ncbi:MAG: hypothetical protein H0W74_08255 [Sphingosinicella sp.]|nr:hypothetical protein [Sphingosinicella sp.]
MLFDLPAAESPIGDSLIDYRLDQRWGVDSEYGRLTDVMVSPPPYLQLEPCQSASVASLAKGIELCSERAQRQHRALLRALRDEGVRCATIPVAEEMPDLSFVRDACLMTPWGLLDLKPAATFETAYVRDHVRGWGIPYLGSIGGGAVEGGDVCLLRPGTVAIGWSGERTDKQGALALAKLFEDRGWAAILTHFDRYFTHLDNLFAPVGRNRALACVEALDPAFLGQIKALGVDLVPVTPAEVQRLGTNILALGGGSILSAADNNRINLELARLGHHVIAVNVDQFTQGGGGIRRLTMPLARVAG